jgi:DNA-binding MarR family transcriptional regulator
LPDAGASQRAVDARADGREDEREIGFVITDVARLLRTTFERRARRLGLTRAQWLVLNRLYRYPGATQSELAEMLEVEKATAGRQIDRMERKGWVVRRPDEADRRVNRLHLTPTALRIETELKAIGEGLLDEATALLSARERDQLTELVGRVKRRLQTMTEAQPDPVAAPRRRRAARR